MERRVRKFAVSIAREVTSGVLPAMPLVVLADGEGLGRGGASGCVGFGLIVSATGAGGGSGCGGGSG